MLASETLAIPCYGFQLQVNQEVNFQADRKRLDNIYNSQSDKTEQLKLIM